MRIPCTQRQSRQLFTFRSLIHSVSVVRNNSMWNNYCCECFRLVCEFGFYVRRARWVAMIERKKQTTQPNDSAREKHTSLRHCKKKTRRTTHEANEDAKMTFEFFFSTRILFVADFGSAFFLFVHLLASHPFSSAPYSIVRPPPSSSSYIKSLFAHNFLLLFVTCAWVCTVQTLQSLQSEDACTHTTNNEWGMMILLQIKRQFFLYTQPQKTKTDEREGRLHRRIHYTNISYPTRDSIAANAK